MPTHRTSTPPGRPAGTTPAPVPGCALSLRVTDVQAAHRRHSAWVEVGEGLLQHCPDPRGFHVAEDARWANLQVRRAEHVYAWAAFLGLGTPTVATIRNPSDRTRTMTATTVSGMVDGVDWLVDHFASDPDLVSSTDPVGTGSAGGDGE